MLRLPFHVLVSHISCYAENGNVPFDGGRAMTRHQYCYTQNDDVVRSGDTHVHEFVDVDEQKKKKILRELISKQKNVHNKI